VTRYSIHERLLDDDTLTPVHMTVTLPGGRQLRLCNVYGEHRGASQHFLGSTLDIVHGSIVEEHVASCVGEGATATLATLVPTIVGSYMTARETSS
jgi:hypothetical protein